MCCSFLKLFFVCFFHIEREHLNQTTEAVKTSKNTYLVLKDRWGLVRQKGREEYSRQREIHMHVKLPRPNVTEWVENYKQFQLISLGTVYRQARGEERGELQEIHQIVLYAKLKSLSFIWKLWENQRHVGWRVTWYSCFRNIILGAEWRHGNQLEGYYNNPCKKWWESKPSKWQ